MTVTKRIATRAFNGSRAPIAYDSPLFDSLRDREVHIWSGEHRAYWCPGALGYTSRLLGAGTWPFDRAYALTRTCGPEKQIYLEAVESPPAVTPTTTTLSEALAAAYADGWCAALTIASAKVYDGALPLIGSPPLRHDADKYFARRSLLNLLYGLAKNPEISSGP